MHFTAALIVLASTLQIGAVVAQSCPSQLANYPPAKMYCAARYPPQPSTTVVTIVPSPVTVTVAAAATTTKASVSTTAAGNGKTATITEVVQKTVTDCNPRAFPTNCKFGGFGGGRLGPHKRETDEIEAEINIELEKRQFWSSNPAMTWLISLAKGPGEVTNVCGCIGTAGKVVTNTVTAPASTITVTSTPAAQAPAQKPPVTTTKRCITPKWCF